MQARPLPLSTKIALWCVAVIVLAMLILPGESISYMKYNAAFAMCKMNLKQVGLAVQTYRGSHAGKMPPALIALPPIINSQSPFWCPLSGNETTRATYHEVAYRYRFLGKPNAADIVCWDSHPHRRWQIYFTWLNRPNRNVLLADGQVKNMSEAEFQKLHLVGQTWIIR